MLLKTLVWVMPVSVVSVVGPSCNNNPYGSYSDRKVFYTSLDENPATLDPQRISDVDSQYVGSNIHDTPYEFHYLKRPLELQPSMARAMPETGWKTVGGRRVYFMRFSLKRGLRFDDDPCFADGRGREITVDDLILAIRRAADDSIEPFGKTFLMDRLIGFREFHENFDEAPQAAIAGVARIDDDTLELLYDAPYPQAIYFLAHVTSSPVPAECLAYYNGEDGRPAYDRAAVASGPYRIAEWRDHHELILERNPNYRDDDRYPETGVEGDRAAGLLDRAGQKLPMLDTVRVLIIKRGPPKWELFGQGYLDLYRNRLDLQERLMQSPDRAAAFERKNVTKAVEVELSSFGWSFNMLDPVIGSNLKLRQALSLAVDREEMIRLFLPGRATIAHGPIPPGIAGHDPEYTSPWSRYDPGRAKELLAEAGYPGGVDPATGRALELQLFDRAAQGRAAIYRFYIDQFADIGVKLTVDQMDFPTLIQKMHAKNFQIIHWGWGADYPDPENFLQLFYGPNAKSTYNSSSYRNAEYDALYEQMARMNDGPERSALIRRMYDILNADLPKTFFFHRQSHYFTQAWAAPVKPSPLDYREMKYWDVDIEERERKVREWNSLSFTAWLIVLCFAAGAVALIYLSRRRMRHWSRGS